MNYSEKYFKSKYLKYKEKYLNLKITQNGQRSKSSFNLEGGAAYPGGGGAPIRPNTFIPSAQDPNILQDYSVSIHKYETPGYTGLRGTTEDKHIVYRQVQERDPGYPEGKVADITLCVVLDGHSDRGEVTTLAKNYMNLILPQYINKLLRFIQNEEIRTKTYATVAFIDTQINGLMAEIFERTDEYVRENHRGNGGCTCSIALLFKYNFNKLYCATLGDSPIIAYTPTLTSYQMILKTDDHDLNNLSELARIQEIIKLTDKRDVIVYDEHNNPRIRGSISALAPTAGFGDFSFFVQDRTGARVDLIKRTPEIRSCIMPPGSFFIIASDSIYEAIRYDPVNLDDKPYISGKPYIGGDSEKRLPQIQAFINSPESTIRNPSVLTNISELQYNHHMDLLKEEAGQDVRGMADNYTCIFVKLL